MITNKAIVDITNEQPLPNPRGRAIPKERALWRDASDLTGKVVTEEELRKAILNGQSSTDSLQRGADFPSRRGYYSKKGRPSDEMIFTVSNWADVTKDVAYECSGCDGIVVGPPSFSVDDENIIYECANPNCAEILGKKALDI